MSKQRAAVANHTINEQDRLSEISSRRGSQMDPGEQEQQQYIPVDELHPNQPEIREVPYQQKQLVPMNQGRRMAPGGQQQRRGPNGPPPPNMRAMVPMGPNGGQMGYPGNGQMVTYMGPNGQPMQLVPMMANQGGQLVPYQKSARRSKKFSVTDWEDKRRRHCAGRMCVNVLYFLCTVLMLIVFIGVFTDVWKSYNKLLGEKEAQIERAKQEYADYCKSINPYNIKNCTQADNLRNQTASDMVTFGSSFSTYLSATVTDGTDNLGWKTIGVIALLFCLCACGSSCSKFMSNVAKDPTQFQRAAHEGRRPRRSSVSEKMKKRKRKDSSSSSDEETKRFKQWRKEQKKALKYGQQAPPMQIGYGYEGMDMRYQQYGGRAPLPGPENNYQALPQYEGQGGPPPPRGAPLMIGNGQVSPRMQSPRMQGPQGARGPIRATPQGYGQSPRGYGPGPQGYGQRPQGVIRMTKETTQQVQGPDGKMRVQSKKQVVEQSVDNGQQNDQQLSQMQGMFDESEVQQPDAQQNEQYTGGYSGQYAEEEGQRYQ